MTLEEYNNQEVPVSRAEVDLQPNEYTMGHWYGAAGHKRASVWVNGYNHEYVIKKGSTRLYTSDGEGNPLRPSVFNLLLL
jgi:hypothetical protein